MLLGRRGGGRATAPGASLDGSSPGLSLGSIKQSGDTEQRKKHDFGRKMCQASSPKDKG